MLGGGASFATVMAAFAYTSGLTGYKSESAEDEVERKEAYKKTYRRPLQETIDELGEGRGKLWEMDHLCGLQLTLSGIYGPGYAERRRQRLLERYGIDVGEAQGGT